MKYVLATRKPSSVLPLSGSSLWSLDTDKSQVPSEPSCRTIRPQPQPECRIESNRLCGKFAVWMSLSTWLLLVCCHKSNVTVR